MATAKLNLSFTEVRAPVSGRASRALVTVGNLATALVVPFEELRMTDVEVVGGKNASLGEMISQLAASHVRVPGGFATTAHAYREFLKHGGLTERISQISAHLQVNKKDFSTHRGLMQLVGKRKRLLTYLSKHNLQGYRQLIEKLGIRK